MKALKSVGEAAGLLGISIWTVRSYIRTGRLNPVRIGRRVLLEEAELERIVTEGRGARDQIAHDAERGGARGQEAVTGGGVNVE